MVNITSNGALIERLRADIDVYDLYPNPAKDGMLFWEFESSEPYPAKQALTSLEHVLIHVGNLMQRIIVHKWDLGNETIPEIFSLARRIERALGHVATKVGIDSYVGKSGVDVHGDINDGLILATTGLREKIVHDSMHIVHANDVDTLSTIDTTPGIESASMLWAIGIDACKLVDDYKPDLALRKRLTDLAVRFSDAQIKELYT
jgi:hypothetical protein